MKYSTKLSDTVHVMVLIAINQEKSLSSASIAESVHTNPGFVRQLMLKLKKAGLMTSVAGHARPSLSKPADQITLLDIYKAVEGDKPLLHLDTHTNPDCGVGINIQLSLQGFYNEIQKAAEEKMNTIIKLQKTLEKEEEEIINEKLEGEKIDVTLPGVSIKCGAPNILEKTIEEVEELFMSLGFDVVDGPEIEEDKYNFELLNIPKGHPARDAQDTFYIVNDEVLLRSQTSPVQARTMLKGNGETPIRMICPGKTYRRDDDDATHSHQFMQIEGLVVDKEISLSDLKGIFDLLAKKLFGENCVTRFRPSYYQFTEPSVETDISCFACNGKGCSLCKNTGWITVAGAGIVHPNVLKNCGYDPNKWTGFAFGFGAERLAMLKYNINDIRTFYTADLREVQVFDRKEN